MTFHLESKLIPVLLVIERLISVFELLPDLETIPRFTNSLSWFSDITLLRVDREVVQAFIDDLGYV
jgi:hypothetical protein